MELDEQVLGGILRIEVQTCIVISVEAFPNFEGTFEVQTYASYFAISGVLIQDGHPITYKSRKL